jgi:hypothetical protein
VESALVRRKCNGQGKPIPQSGDRYDKAGARLRNIAQSMRHMVARGLLDAGTGHVALTPGIALAAMEGN